MGFLAAIPAAIGGLLGGGAAAGAGALGAGALEAGAAGAGALGAGSASLIPAAAGASMTAGMSAAPLAASMAAPAAAGMGEMTLGAGLGAAAPFLKGLSTVASSGADLLSKFGDIPISKILGETAGKAAGTAAEVPSSGVGANLASLKQGLQFGGTLRDLMSGGGKGEAKPGALPQTAMTMPSFPSPVAPMNSQSTPTGGGGQYVPSAKTIAQMMFQR